jgi:glycyl-tRNA synthetase
MSDQLPIQAAPISTQSAAIELKDIISHAKEYGFIFPSSEIYDGFGAVYDYGQTGVQLKNNIKQVWWKAMTQLHDTICGIDSAIFMHPLTWKASGHVDAFNDPLVDNKDSKKRYRADVLIEDKAAQYEKEGQPEKGHALLAELGLRLTNEDLSGVRQLLLDEHIVCPISGTANWTDVRQFNLMFSTQVGSVAEDSSTVYLRPETAQGIFVNYLNVQKTGRMKIPFGIAQIGKAFRNEIVARQFIFRMREFEQMEMQFFVRPGTEDEFYEYWKATRLKFHIALGLKADNLRFHEHEKLAHYAKAAVDIEYNYPFGFKEMEGIHSRSDFDLKAHEALSGKKIQYFDNELNANYTPYVVETSVGADRLFLSILSEALTNVTDDAGKQRTYLNFHPALAPVKAAILPLVRKDGLAEKGRAIYNSLKLNLECIYEERDSIGKRYTRQDLIGTPFCIVIDYETMENDTVTVRERNTGTQVRMPVSELLTYLEAHCAIQTILKQLV